MGNSCATPTGSGTQETIPQQETILQQETTPQQETIPEPKGQAENKNESAKPEDEPEPTKEPTESTPMAPNPQGVLFTFKVPQPEKLVFHKNKKDEVLDPKTDPKTLSNALYCDPKEEWLDPNGVDMLVKVRKFLNEGKEVSVNSELLKDPVPDDKVLLIERTFSIKDIDMIAKPLGLTFREEIPIIITKVSESGNAKKLGAKVGWELVKVGDNDLRGKSYQESFALINASIDQLS